MIWVHLVIVVNQAILVNHEHTFIKWVWLVYRHRSQFEFSAERLSGNAKTSNSAIWFFIDFYWFFIDFYWFLLIFIDLRTFVATFFVAIYADFLKLKIWNPLYHFSNVWSCDSVESGDSGKAIGVTWTSKYSLTCFVICTPAYMWRPTFLNIRAHSQSLVSNIFCLSHIFNVWNKYIYSMYIQYIFNLISWLLLPAINISWFCKSLW